MLGMILFLKKRMESNLSVRKSCLHVNCSVMIEHHLLYSILLRYFDQTN